MKYTNIEQCPYCGSIRFNVAYGYDQKNQYEEHRFCRACDGEYVFQFKELENTVEQV